MNSIIIPRILKLIHTRSKLKAMDCPIQKFQGNQLSFLQSKCVFEIENLQNYENNEQIESAKVEFFELDSEWTATIIPNFYSNGWCYVDFRINLRLAEVCRMKKCQYQVSGTVGTTKILESSYKTVDKRELIYQTRVSQNSLLNLLSKNGSLVVTIQVNIKYMTDTMFSQQTHCTSNAKELNLSDQYSNLANDATFSDFTFVVKGKPFKVHKNILASESETMRAMFTSQLKETIQGACIVDDIESNIFHHLLQFIYAGITPANIDEVAIDLFKAAHYYRCAKLMEICKENIHFRLSECNALEIYELATLYDIEGVRIDAWNIVKHKCFKIFFPLKNEPLPLNEFQEIRDIWTKQKEFWLKQKATVEASMSN